MVGIVIVSHSRSIAAGVIELAREMGGDEVVLSSGAGTDEPDALGTDALRVLEAINQSYSDDGVLVLMDLGSAVMSAELAVEMLEPNMRGHVVLTEAPLVEGAVSAATAARLGRSLKEVADEALGGLQGKTSHLHAGEGGPIAPDSAAEYSPREGEGEPVEATIMVANPLGLHARPAARFVQAAGESGARVQVTNLTTGRGPVDGTSLNAVATLGASEGHEILVHASGDAAAATIAALQSLASDNFGDPRSEPEAQTPAPVVPAMDDLPEGALTGLAASPGVAIGEACRLGRQEHSVPTELADDPDAELSRLTDAIAAARVEIVSLRKNVARSASEYEAQIFDAHLLWLEDTALRDHMRNLIVDEKRNAADALWTVMQEAAREIERLDDERLRSRAGDVVDVGRRVLGRLLGHPARVARITHPGILLVDELTPSDAAGLDPGMVRGIVAATGGPTSHGAILARALGVPAVVGIGDELLAVPEDRILAVDGDAGVVIVAPSSDVVARFEARMEAGHVAEAAAKASAGRPATTTDGTTIEVAANVGSLEDALRAVAAGADGVGLLRTEFLFLGRDEMPGVDEQLEVYAAIGEALGERPFTIRTLDVGADKPLPYAAQQAEENPFLGLRGIRLGLARRELLDVQLRALARLARVRPVRVMFPMVATVAELNAAKGALDEAVGTTRPDGLEIGVMIEVPAAALTAGHLAASVDFFSIGTNDLSQYTMAAERGNAQVASLADPVHPAVLRLISHAAEAAHAHGTWVGVCGELAGEAGAAPLLLGLGVTELSMAPPSIPSVKQSVRSVTLAAARSLAQDALNCDSAEQVRALIEGEAGR